MSNNPFSSKATKLLIFACSVSMLVCVIWLIFQEELSSVKSSGNDSYSYSALGHKAFVELLVQLDIPILSSRHSSDSKATNGVLLLMEPHLQPTADYRTQLFSDLAWGAFDVLVVLPKYRGLPDPQKPGWAASVWQVSDDRFTAIFEALEISAEAVRIGDSTQKTWDVGPWRGTPEIDDCQLIKTSELTPLLACDEGIFLGLVNLVEQDLKLMILSDPDLLTNHGIQHGDNAILAVQAIEYLRDGSGLVVVDETLHGHELSPSFFRALLRFPLVFITVQVLVILFVLLWLALGRFGAARQVTPQTNRGIEYLIDNTAELLHWGKHHTYLLTRYMPATVHSVCRRLHLPLPGKSERARDRLLAISQTRSPDFSLPDVEKLLKNSDKKLTLRSTETLTIANDLHRWQKEMTDGL